MKTLLLASVVTLSGVVASPNKISEASALSSSSSLAQKKEVHGEIVRMMDSSAHAWNQGDLDRFMSDYAPDTTTTFVTPKGILRGRAAIRNVYARRFTPGAARDSLSFENVEVDVLSKDVVNVIAFYRLMRKDSTTSKGPTSLVMRKLKGRWQIIHDHSS